MIRRALFAALACVTLSATAFAAGTTQTVKPLYSGSTTDPKSFPTALSAADRALLTSVRDALNTLAGAISSGKMLVQLADELGNLLSWANPATGLLQANASVTTTQASCSTASSLYRGRIFTNWGTDKICMSLDSDGSPTVTCGAIPNTPTVLFPGQMITIPKDDYTGEIYCRAASGTQDLARGYIQ